MQVLSLLRQCSWPALPAKYDQALRMAVRFILERYAAHAIVLSGTILEGAPDASSDLDIYVIHVAPQRQRLQRWFNSVPAEIFVNPACAIRGYFETERDRPCTANMLATGHVIYAQGPMVEQLRGEAATWLQRLPDLSEEQLRVMRYFAADQLDNAKDRAAQDPAVGQMILHEAVRRMLHYCFLAANRHLPRDKRLLHALETLDGATAQLAREFYTATDQATRFELAHALAMRTIRVTGFFEWESSLETLPDCDE
jgi:predicted nucleotidyltransferase